MALIIPNSIDNDTPADAAELQQNFSVIQTHVNSNVLHRDGSVGLTAPILLPGDPTQPNHAANKSYVDTNDALKVNKDGSTPITGPLIVESARIGNRGDGPVGLDAKFCHKDVTHGSIGFNANALGDHSAINGTGRTFNIWEKTASGHAHLLGITAVGTTLNTPLDIDSAATEEVLQLRSSTDRPYLSWFQGTTRLGYMQFVNTATSGSMYLVGESNIGSLSFSTNTGQKMYLHAAGMVVLGQGSITGSNTGGYWNQANFMVYGQNAHTRISLHTPGYAPQLRISGAWGEALEGVNQANNVHIPFVGLPYVSVSAAATKKDIRPLRPDRKLAHLKRKVDADKVELPDVMALRPVVYRPKAEPLKLTYNAKGEHNGEKPIPNSEPAGRQGRRERLGLIADEVATVMPSAVVCTADGEPGGIEYDQIIVALLDHVQTLTERIAALEAAK